MDNTMHFASRVPFVKAILSLCKGVKFRLRTLKNEIYLNFGDDPDEVEVEDPQGGEECYL